MLRLTKRRFLLSLISQTKIGFAAQRTIVSSPLPDVPFPETNYVDYLLSNAKKHADKTALIDGISGTKYSYSQILEATKNVSSGLVKLGLKPKETLCIFASNSPEFVFAKCGVLAMDGISTFANPAWKHHELSFHLKDSQSRYIITTPALLPVAQEAAAESKSVLDILVIGGGASQGCLSFDKVLLEDDGDESPFGQFIVNAKDDVALMPYSSGTTGFPKGVMLTHRNVTANLAQMQSLKKISEGQDVFLGSLPFFHIYGMMVVIGNALFKGCTVVTLPDFRPDTYLRAIQDYKVTYLHMVPPQVLFLMNHPLVKDFDLSSIGQLMCAAAPLERTTEIAFREQFRARIPRIDIFQGYGLTEMSPLSHIMPPKEHRLPGKEGSVGLMVPNMLCKIVKPETNEELGPGQPGELLIKGPNVTKGYLGNPDATKSTIQNDWFRTGDMLYYDEDNYFYVVDRLKEFIKYKAMQVAPAELEALLLTHPKVLDSAVVGRKDEQAGELPTAFVVVKSELAEKDVQDFVAGLVADYKKLRGGVIFTDKIPRSASGKILRKDLRKLVN